MFENWSEPARLALFRARLIAARSGSGEIGLEHVVLGTLHAGRATGARFASQRDAVEAIERDLERYAVSTEAPSNGELPFSTEVATLLRILPEAAGTGVVELEDILRAILTTTSGPASRSLARLPQ